MTGVGVWCSRLAYIQTMTLRCMRTARTLIAPVTMDTWKIQVGKKNRPKPRDCLAEPHQLLPQVWRNE
jgi:hypothetical protein